MTRVAAVDIGSNSTRLLITDGTRRSIVTRLGEGVDASGRLGEAPMRRVLDVLRTYRDLIDGAPGAAVLTSAVRDAANGAEFAEQVREVLGFPARILSGDEEAKLTFAGATANRTDPDPILVIDIGGGSTELVVGHGRDVSFFVSMQVGVVRMTERHVPSDPPRAEEIAALRAQVAEIIRAGVPDDVRTSVTGAVAVAGTATSTAAIDLELDPYDPDKVHGHVLTPRTLDAELAMLAAMPNAERREVPGLHPDRAPTIVAGVAILIEVLEAFGLTETEVSDRDILWGVALRSAS